MRIVANAVGKKFNGHWIFRNLNLEIIEKSALAITGANGSGKSTLLKILAGYLTASEGKIHYSIDGKGLDDENAVSKISFCAPYYDLVEELSLIEFLQFHSNFKQPLIPIEMMAVRSDLSSSKNKPIADFSSGMKQRVKLILQFYYESDSIFLDEPTSNLDANGIQWYLDEMENLISKKTIIIASNDPQEYNFLSNQFVL